MRVELPDGQWAELRNPDEVPERLHRPLELAELALQREMPEPAKPEVTVELPDDVDETAQAAFGAPPVAELRAEAAGPAPRTIPSDGLLEAVNHFQELLVVALVTGWSYDTAVDVPSVRDLPKKVYRPLSMAATNLWGEYSKQQLDPENHPL